MPGSGGVGRGPFDQGRLHKQSLPPAAPAASGSLLTASAQFDGVGVVTATPVRIRIVSAAFVGAGVLAVASAIRIRTSAASLAGIGVLSGVPVRLRLTSGSFTGVGTLAAIPVVLSSTKIASATFSGVATLFADPVVILGEVPPAGPPPGKSLKGKRKRRTYDPQPRRPVYDPHLRLAPDEVPVEAPKPVLPQPEPYPVEPPREPVFAPVGGFPRPPLPGASQAVEPDLSAAMAHLWEGLSEQQAPDPRHHELAAALLLDEDDY